MAGEEGRGVVGRLRGQGWVMQYKHSPYLRNIDQRLKPLFHRQIVPGACLSCSIILPTQYLFHRLFISLLPLIENFIVGNIGFSTKVRVAARGINTVVPGKLLR